MSGTPNSTSSSDSTVLLAVADEASGDLLEDRMSRRGIRAVRVVCGREVHAELDTTAFDLIVIESRLPGLTGLELLQLAETRKVKGRPGVVVLGQGGNDEEVVRAFELGAAEYITRPFAPDVAVTRILRFLNSESQRTAPSSPAAAAGLLLVPFGNFSWGLTNADFLSLTITVTGGLLCVAVLFAVLATTLHARYRLRRWRQQPREERWKRQLFDVLAGDRDPASLIDDVGDHQGPHFLQFLIPYAVTFDGRALNTIRSVASPFLSCLEDDLESRRPGTRARAVQLFGLLGDTSCRSLLRRRLDDPSPLVTYTAFRWLCRRGTAASIRVLLDRIDALAGMEVNHLSSLLLHLGDEAAPALRRNLRDRNASTFARVVCAETLRWMGDGESAPLASQLLAYEPDPELTAALLRLLRRVGRSEHALLARSYCDSNVPFVRIHAARALGQIGDADDDRNILGRLVSDAESRWVALNAAKSLTELGQVTPLNELTERPHHHRADLAESVLKEPQ